MVLSDSWARAAKRVIITTERLVHNSEIRNDPAATAIPFYMVDAVVEVGRKIVGNQGVYYRQYADEIRQFIASANSELNEFTQPLAAALDTLDQLTAWVLDRSQNNPNEIGAASVEYLHVFGYTTYAYMWALMAKAALGKEADEAFYVSKLGTARFYFARLLPRIDSLSASVKAGSDSLYLLDEAHF